MKHTCTNISVRIPHEVYTHIMKYLLDNEWGYAQLAHERHDMQYIRVYSGSITPEFYLQRYDVIHMLGTKTECFLSGNQEP